MVALIKGNVVKEELGTSLIELISLRNRLAHRYRYVETEELIDSAKRLVDEILPVFRGWMYATIERHRRDKD